MEGVWKVLNDEWRKVGLDTVTRVYKSWSERCRMIVQEKGSHIENLRSLHGKRLSSN